MTDLSLVSTETAVACQSTDVYIFGNIFVDDTGVLSAHDDVLARSLYLRAVAATAIAKGYVIAVAGNSRRRQQLASSKRGVVLQTHSASTAQLIAEAALERTLAEQRALLKAQRIELANTKATLAVLKEQESQLLMKRHSFGSPRSMQVRSSPQRVPAASCTSQDVSDNSLAAQTAADMAAAELIAEEQLAAIQHQQAGIKAAHMKAQKQKHKLAEESRHSRTNSDKSSNSDGSTKKGQLAQTDSLAGKHAIDIDAVSMEIYQYHCSPPRKVGSSCLETIQHIGSSAVGGINQDGQWAEQSSCSESSTSDTSYTDEQQQMRKMLCCPITKITFVDPVIAADGHTYERTAMEHWMQHNALSAVSGDLLPHRRLVPNMVIKSMVAAQSC